MQVEIARLLEPPQEKVWQVADQSGGETGGTFAASGRDWARVQKIELDERYKAKG